MELYGRKSKEGGKDEGKRAPAIFFSWTSFTNRVSIFLRKKKAFKIFVQIYIYTCVCVCVPVSSIIITGITF